MPNELLFSKDAGFGSFVFYFYMCVKSSEKGNDDCPEGGRLGIGDLLAFVIFCVHVFGIVLFSFRRL